MPKSLSLLLAGAALATLAGPASAQYGQPYGQPAGQYGPARPTATLYEFPNYGGRSIVIEGENGNLQNVGFNDRARSGRFEGGWRICADSDYRSRCETVSGPVPNLDQYSLSGTVSSLRAEGDDGGYPGGPGYEPGYPGGGYGGGTATLYEFSGFRGRSVTITRENANLSGIGFNDRTGSARFEGGWRVCADANYRGRCETLTGPVSDMERTTVGRGVSSLQVVDGGYPGPGPGPGYPGPGYPGGGYPGGGYPGYPGREGVEGRTTVFYPQPDGAAGMGKAAADAFCRRMGHTFSVYHEAGQRTLSDVLCRK